MKRRRIKPVWYYATPIVLLALYGAFLFALKVASEAESPVDPGPGVDLLDLIDIDRGTVVGEWGREGRVLVSPESEQYATLKLPYTPPEEYDLEVTVERRSSMESLVLGLTAGKTQFLVMLDGKIFEGGRPLHVVCSAIRDIDGKGNNESVFSGNALSDKGPSRILCTVRRSSVEVSVDGKRIIRWSGDRGRLSLPDQWRLSSTNALFIGSYYCSYAFTHIQINPISGRGRKTR